MKSNRTVGTLVKKEAVVSPAGDDAEDNGIMKIRTSTGLVIAVLITCFIVCSVPSTFAKPHEELTFEPIDV